jgi:hypothetical protein
VFTVPLPFITAYIEELAKALKHYRPHRDLSDSQQKWLKYCLMGIMLTNTVCWAAFERVGLAVAIVLAHYHGCLDIPDCRGIYC